MVGHPATYWNHLLEDLLLPAVVFPLETEWHAGLTDMYPLGVTYRDLIVCF